MRGDRLRQARVDAGHTQESLSELLDIGNRQIWRYEKGETEPDGVVIAKLAHALNVSADYLLGLSDDPTPPELVAGLSPLERAVLAALRRGENYEAIKAIVAAEATK